MNFSAKQGLPSDVDLASDPDCQLELLEVAALDLKGQTAERFSLIVSGLRTKLAACTNDEQRESVALSIEGQLMNVRGEVL